MMSRKAGSRHLQDLRLWLFLSLGVLIAVGPLGCFGQDAQIISVRKLLIDVSPGFEKAFDGVQKSDLRELGQQILEHEKRWRYAPNDEAGLVLRFRLDGVQRKPSREAGKDLWVVTARLQQPTGQTAPDYHGYAAVPYSVGDDAADTFRSAADQCLGQIQMAANSASATTEILLGWLNPQADGKQPKGDKKRLAIRVLGARKSKAATKPLGEILLGEDPALAQEALTALTLIGDPNGLQPVIDYAERKPAPVRKKAIMAAKEMGGKLAAAWLFTLSTGHEDPSVRHAASTALSAVELRAARPRAKPQKAPAQ